MAVKKPAMVKKTPKLTKYVCGGERAKTTKIAWHYTGAHDVPAINTIKYWFNEIADGMKVNGKYYYASSHYLVDLDGTIYEYIPEHLKAWTTNAANSYSIGIECATTGTDDHYSDAEYKSMVKLGAYLADKYNLDPRTDFIRHYDVTRKVCPRYFVNNPKAWKQFKLDCYNATHKEKLDDDLVDWKNGEYGINVKVTDELNVRDKRPDKDGTLGKIIDTLKKDTVVKLGYVLNDWGGIYYEDKKGFVNSRYLKKIEEEPKPTVTPDKTTPDKTTADKTIQDKKDYDKPATVIADSLNVRASRPDMDGKLGKIVDTIKKGKIVTAGYSLDGWCSIYYDGKKGFVNSKYLELV